MRAQYTSESTLRIVRLAANHLYIHPKTVRYRVGRIREEYGIDVHATDDMMQVLLSDKLVALLGPDWEPELNER